MVEGRALGILKALYQRGQVYERDLQPDQVEIMQALAGEGLVEKLQQLEAWQCTGAGELKARRG